MPRERKFLKGHYSTLFQNVVIKHSVLGFWYVFILKSGSNGDNVCCMVVVIMVCSIEFVIHRHYEVVIVMSWRIEVIKYKVYIFMRYRREKKGNTGLFFEIESIFVPYLGEIYSDREIILGNALLRSVRKFGV
jgi:hypothetical protein